MSASSLKIVDKSHLMCYLAKVKYIKAMTKRAWKSSFREPPVGARRQRGFRQPMASELKGSKDFPVGLFRVRCVSAKGLTEPMRWRHMPQFEWYRGCNYFRLKVFL